MKGSPLTNAGSASLFRNTLAPHPLNFAHPMRAGIRL